MSSQIHGIEIVAEIRVAFAEMADSISHTLKPMLEEDNSLELYLA